MYRNETGYPSVSDVLAPYEDRRWYKPIHSKRGDRVHGAITADQKGLFVPALPEDWSGYWQSYLAFKETIDDVLFIEERMIDPDLGYCGQPDILIQSGTETILPDWKTSVAVNKFWPFRLAAYRRLTLINKGIEIDLAMAVRLRKKKPKTKGWYPLVNIYTPAQLDKYFDVFCGAVKVYYHLLQDGKLFAPTQPDMGEY
jgi:hypothetical protein